MHGLCGEVVAIVYDAGTKPVGAAGPGREVDHPFVVFMKADKYLGPSFADLTLSEQERLRMKVSGVLAVQAIERKYDMTVKGRIVKCSRLMLPLRLGWAHSIHKAQGMTLPEYPLDPGAVELQMVRVFPAPLVPLAALCVRTC